MERDDLFPADFLWGASTASYQIEGSVRVDGRSDSIWDVFCRRPGAVLGGMTGDLACDSYLRWRDDIALLRGLGVDAYRFSLAWPRILPEGGGRPNQAGLDHYRRLAEGLLEAGIEPWACLYHWDLPQVLEERGGWPERDTALRFADYAVLCFRELGDLVSGWLTLNEPWCSAFLGYAHGVHAPGRRDRAAAYRAAHHLLLGHGLAVGAFRDTTPRGPGGGAPPIGLALNPALHRPATRREEDRLAALRASVERTDLFMDPLFGRGYPAGHLADHPEARMPVETGDYDKIAQRVDFVAVNYYNEEVVEAAPAGPDNPDGFRSLPSWEGRTEMDWAVVPGGLYRLLRRISDTWSPAALYVSENGAAFRDEIDPAGRVRDGERIDYLRGHIAACERSVLEGVPLKGYFVWSLLDNFEWALGYSRRFGLVHVDFATQRRRPKDSYYWYRDLVAGHDPSGFGSADCRPRRSPSP